MLIKKFNEQCFSVTVSSLEVIKNKKKFGVIIECSNKYFTAINCFSFTTIGEAESFYNLINESNYYQFIMYKFEDKIN